MTFDDTQVDGTEANLVEIWLRKDPVRWVAGAAAGLIAGLFSLLIYMVICNQVGLEYLYPVKVAAIPFLGGEALTYGWGSSVVVGLIIYLGISTFLGVIYAHFTGTNSFKALLGVGLTWGVFSWIFISNLYVPAFREVFVAEIPAGISFIVNLIYGVALTSVAFFDRILRG